MIFPKAVLCQLGEGGGDEEAQLRSVGFATGSIGWKEIDMQRNGWIQLLPVLEDPAVLAWVIAGEPDDFTPAIRSQIALLTLAMRREKPLLVALRLQSEGAFVDVPPALAQVLLFKPADAFAAKLMALRVRPRPAPELPFVCLPHLDPLLGLWLEVSPPLGARQEDFMIGVFGGEISAFGVGPSGVVPEKSSLHYPQLGIRGDIGGREFFACAAKNALGEGVSCYLRLEGFPEGVFLTRYEAMEAQEGLLYALELV